MLLSHFYKFGKKHNRAHFAIRLCPQNIFFRKTEQDLWKMESLWKIKTLFQNDRYFQTTYKIPECPS